jgi:hypothetical protein
MLATRKLDSARFPIIFRAFICHSLNQLDAAARCHPCGGITVGCTEMTDCQVKQITVLPRHAIVSALNFPKGMMI